MHLVNESEVSIRKKYNFQTRCTIHNKSKYILEKAQTSESLSRAFTGLRFIINI